MPPPGRTHAKLQILIGSLLLGVAGRPLVCGEVGIDLGDDTLVGYDAAVLRMPVEGNRMLVPVDVLLAVAVSVSTQARDLGLKRRLYAAAGVAFDWAVDAERSVVHVHADPVEGEYTSVHTVRFGEPLAVPGTDATITLD